MRLARGPLGVETMDDFRMRGVIAILTGATALVLTFPRTGYT